MVCLRQHTYILESCKQSSMPQSLIKEEIKKEAFSQQAGEVAYCWSWWDKIDCLMLTYRKREIMTEVRELYFIRYSTTEKDIHS